MSTKASQMSALDNLPRVGWDVPIGHTLTTMARMTIEGAARNPRSAGALIEAASMMTELAKTFRQESSMPITIEVRDLLVWMVELARKDGKNDLVRKFQAIIDKIKSGQHRTVTASASLYADNESQLNQQLDRIEKVGKSLFRNGA